MKKRNILLTIAYHGKNYAGWQIQQDDSTVQAELVKAIEATTGEKVILYGSGRTDAGVHAKGQKANFMTDSTIPAEKMAAALNTRLPKDISVLSSCEVEEDFHAQFCAHSKTYCYRLYCSQHRDPFLDDFAWQIRLPKAFHDQLDLDAMKAAAQFFLGEHDFAGLMSTGSPVKSTVREIYRLEIRKNGGFVSPQLIEIEITGSGFLYHMVRIIAGTLVAVGKNEIDWKEIGEYIASGDRTRMGITAPAKGLMLMDIQY